jgi:hypothetical protein
MSKLTNLERETIIVFNEQEATASIFTYNAGYKQRLKDLSISYPDVVTLEPPCALTDESAVSYIVPKRWIKISPPRKCNLTEEQRALKGQQLRNGKKGT